MPVAPLQLIANPVRREILRLIWTHEQAAGRIASHFRLTFGAVSHHLRLLLDAGAVRRRRAGKQLFYQAQREALGPVAAMLEAMWSEKLNALKSLAEAEQRRLKRPNKPKATKRRKSREATAPREIADRANAPGTGAVARRSHAIDQSRNRARRRRQHAD